MNYPAGLIRRLGAVLAKTELFSAVFRFADKNNAEFGGAGKKLPNVGFARPDLEWYQAQNLLDIAPLVGVIQEDQSYQNGGEPFGVSDGYVLQAVLSEDLERRPAIPGLTKRQSVVHRVSHDG
ncbi:MAG TPA: hypothetical protein VMC43_03750 [Candidatus Paceibacterota bacterium]|nr:hypothetical protein [Candidatus Paceibacterota bacterium]